MIGERVGQRCPARSTSHARVCSFARGSDGTFCVEFRLVEAARSNGLSNWFIGDTRSSLTILQAMKRAVSMASERSAKDAPIILVLDDEPTIQSLVARILERERFVVVTAATGSAALAALKAHGDRIALMIVDITLPDMCGREFVHHATARHGDRPILYFSGVDQKGRTDALHQRTIFLAKPFAAADLITRVYALLEHRAR